MKKITGKVVSLVLALALVVTSFSSSFAFATTKSMVGVVTDTYADDVYLANGGASREIDLNAFLITNSDFNMETKDHKAVDDVKVSSISHVSGDKLVSLNLENSDDDAYLKLKSNSDNGTEVISVLFKADYSDDDGNDYTVRATQQLTVHVYDDGEIAFGKATVNDPGKGVDDLDDLPMTAGAKVQIGIYSVGPDTTSAFAVFAPAKSVYLSDENKGYVDSGYALEITSGDSDVQIPDIETNKGNTATTLGGPVTVTVGKHNTTPIAVGSPLNQVTGDASTGNFTITAKKLVANGTSGFKESTDTDDKYTLKAKIGKKIDVATLGTYVASQKGAEYASTFAGDNSTSVKDSNYTILKSDGKTELSGYVDYKGNDVTATDKELNFPVGTGTVSVDEDSNVKKISGTMYDLIIGDATVDAVDLDGGSVTVDEGRVGDISTGNDTASEGFVTVSDGAKVGDIDAGDADDGSDTVAVDGATTGTITTDGTVTLDTSNDDDATSTGLITALKVTANADEAKITVAGIKASDEDAEINLYNSDTAQLDVKSIDFDSYDGVTLDLGDKDDEDDIFTGSIPAPVNAVNGTIESVNEDTNAAISGKVDVDTISIDSDSALTFSDSVTVGTVDGDGTLVVAPGALYVSDSASGTILKLSGNIAAGTVAFKADADNVDVEDFDTYGFTLTKSTASSVDTFKIASTTFAGVQINKASSSIAKGYSETFTAGAYPTGTAIPTGYTVTWDFDGTNDVFSMTSTGNSATVKVNSIDSTFSSQNVGTLTATLYDEDGYELDDYAAAKCIITATAIPAATSDTNSALSVAKGASYTMKVTSTTAPAVTTGSNGVFSVVLASKNGNDYFYKLTATGAVNAATGVYLNGTKIFVATVKAFAFTSDTTKDTTVKGAYTFKITSATTPTVSVGSAAFKLAFVSKTGNAYLYKLTSAGAAGTKVGVYVNGAKAFVAIVG
jgi:hypothetical protein